MIDPILASRLQFAIAITIHILFASLSVGLAPYLVYFTVQEVRTGETRYRKLRSFWTKIFALGFVMGTVTGIPMSFMFGTNFADFSTIAGELIGGPLSFEAKMAFFLEAIFLGVLLFGRDRVTGRFYALSAFFVALGAWLSAFWILVVNSWMQTPRGYEVATDGGTEIVRMTDPVAAFFNPRFPWMFVHMQNAAIISVTLLIAGVAAYFVWKNRESEAWNTALRIAIVVLLLTSVFQVLHGDMYGRHIAETQPQKFAAMEAHYDTERGADLHIIAIPTDLEAITDPRADNLYTVSIPYLTSFLASGGDPAAEVTGLNDFEYESPPVAIVFWSFRIMVGLGFWFVFLGLWGAYERRKGTVRDSSRYLIATMLSAPLGFIALVTGWYVTEVGRQPWLIQGVLETSDGVSPALGQTEALVTLIGVSVGYLFLLGVFLYLVRRIIIAERDDAGDSDERPTIGEVIASD